MPDYQLTYTDSGVTDRLIYSSHGLRVSESYVPMLPPVDPYNPLNLPPMTMRVKLAPGYAPDSYQGWITQSSLVDASENIWDLTADHFAYIGAEFCQIHPVEILGANTSGYTSFAYTFSSGSHACTDLTSVCLFDTRSATSMESMFQNCTSLVTLPVFPTGSVTHMTHMCTGCTALTAVPLLDTSSVTQMDFAFSSCINIEHGALALYQQASQQATPPGYHQDTFTSCGSNTTTGAAELAQIPTSWGGTLI